eukprot:g14291.t1 g14291   contig9:1544359-1544976(+)
MNDVALQKRMFIVGLSMEQSKHEESIKLQMTKIANLNPLLTQLEKENKRLAALDPSLANAGPMKTKVDAVRSQMEKAEKSLEALRSRHFAQCTLVVTQVPSKEQDKKDCEISKYSWKVKLTGKKKEVYVDLIESNNAWSTVPLYATGDKVVSKPKSKKAHVEARAFELPLTYQSKRSISSTLEVSPLRSSQMDLVFTSPMQRMVR